MIGFDYDKAPPFLLEKMNNLCRALLQEKKEFEHVAAVINNKDLQNTMLTVAQESNQYACELCSQIHSLGGVPDTGKNQGYEDSINLNDENEILHLCKVNEDKVIGAYRDILNESSSYDELTKMMRYQLNEMSCAFMLVNELGALKFHL